MTTSHGNVTRPAFAAPKEDATKSLANAATNARFIKVEISRAKSYIKRYELEKSIDVMLDILEKKRNMPVIGADKSEIDLLMADFALEFNRSNLVHEFLRSVNYGKKEYLRHVPGKELEMINKLTALRLKMSQRVQEEKNREANELQAKCDDLLNQGRKLIESKEYAKARVSLKTAVEQFSSNPGLLVTVGTLLLEGNSPKDAEDVLRRAVEMFPADPEGHRGLIAAYEAQGRLGEAEDAYKNSLKQFGEHPKTLLNLAKLQMRMHKPYDAADTAKRAFDLDNSLTEARDIFDRYE